MWGKVVFKKAVLVQIVLKWLHKKLNSPFSSSKNSYFQNEANEC